LRDLVFTIFFACLGACIGSFLNVVVYRLPRGQSLVFPGSRCPRCEHPLAWYDNLPVIGWLMLRGKCRYCGQPISPRYPIIEFVTAALFALFFVAIFRFGQGPFWEADGHILRMDDIAKDWPLFGLLLLSVAVLLATSLIDAELYIIPAPLPLVMAGAGVLVHTLVDYPKLPGAIAMTPAELALAAGGAIGLLLSIALLKLNIFPLSFAEGGPPLEVEKEQEADLPDFTPAQIRSEIRKEMLFLMPPLLIGGLSCVLEMRFELLRNFWHSAAQYDWIVGLLGSIFGGLIGGLTVWLTRIFGSYVFGKEAMGLGDIDLMFAVGTVVGPGAAVVAFLIAPFFGLPLAILMWLLRSRRQIPYVPYLAAGSVVVMLFYYPIFNYLRPGMIVLAGMIQNAL
jgi:leader peptidase (prepilin peptidase) / N-methyltransferase